MYGIRLMDDEFIKLIIGRIGSEIALNEDFDVKIKLYEKLFNGVMGTGYFDEVGDIKLNVFVKRFLMSASVIISEKELKDDKISDDEIQFLVKDFRSEEGYWSVAECNDSKGVKWYVFFKEFLVKTRREDLTKESLYDSIDWYRRRNKRENVSRLMDCDVECEDECDEECCCDSPC